MNLGGQPNNEIWYTTADGVVLTLGTTDFGANILTHTYEDGNGVITFDSAVTRIGAYAFAECSTLASITIPNSVTEIGDAALQYTALTQITMPSSVTKIGWYAFQGVSITRVDIADLASWCAIEFNGNLSNPLWDGAMLHINNVSLSPYGLPDGITRISNYAFYGLGNPFYTLNIPSSVTYIGNYAFAECSNAPNVDIAGDSIEYIGDYAFAGSAMGGIVFEGAPPVSVGENIFGTDTSTTIYVPSEHLDAYKALLSQYEYNIQVN